MKRQIPNRLLLFLCGTALLLTTGCNKSDDDDTPSTGSNQINTLADLKALFDKGEITHIDYVTIENRVLLDEEIESMTIYATTNVFDFELMEIVTIAPPSSRDAKGVQRETHTTSLTFADEIVNSDLPTTHWAETISSLNGTTIEGFAPHAFLQDSEINTASLAILDDKLQIKFKKK